MLKDKIIKIIDSKINNNKEAIKSLLLPCIDFKIESNNTAFSISKIGGYPSISDEQFPFLQEEPLAFIGQIDLTTISQINDVLPSTGILCFFIYTGNVGYAYPNKKGEFKVIHLENPAEISEIFKDKYKSLKEYSISFLESYSFPSYQESIIEMNNITEYELNIISEIEEDIMFSINDDYNIPHQVLGHPYAIQGTVRFWWAANYLEVDINNELPQETIKKIKEIENDFVLLLQLNFGDEKIEIDYFGDSIAYFGIHKKDLANKDFDKVMLVMQNT